MGPGEGGVGELEPEAPVGAVGDGLDGRLAVGGGLQGGGPEQMLERRQGGGHQGGVVGGRRTDWPMVLLTVDSVPFTVSGVCAVVAGQLCSAGGFVAKHCGLHVLSIN